MIEIRNLCKSYNQKQVFKALNIDIKTHEINTIIGASGCGKTTLLRILAGLEPYETGTITGLLGKRISYVFQEDRLMPWLNVYENIYYVLGHETKEVAQAKIEWILKIMQLETHAKSAIDTLSGGMKRRVALARGIVYTSDLLMLDEPFKGFDEALRDAVLRELMKYWKEQRQTVLLVTHEEQLVAQLGHTIRLQQDTALV